YAGSTTPVLPGAHGLVRQRGTQRCPAGVRERLGEVAVASQVGNPPVFASERVVRTDQRQRGLAVNVASLPPPWVLRRCDHNPRWWAALTARVGGADCPGWRRASRCWAWASRCCAFR